MSRTTRMRNYWYPGRPNKLHPRLYGLQEPTTSQAIADLRLHPVQGIWPLRRVVLLALARSYAWGSEKQLTVPSWVAGHLPLPGIDSRMPGIQVGSCASVARIARAVTHAAFRSIFHSETFRAEERLGDVLSVFLPQHNIATRCLR